MNGILKFSGVLLMLVALLSSCEEKQWVENEVAMVPVYAIVDLQKTTAVGLSTSPEGINVYKEMLMHIERKANSVYQKDFSNYNDMSTDEEIMLSYSVAEEYTSANDTIKNVLFEYTALRADSLATLNISEVLIAEDGTEEANLVVSYHGVMYDSEVYY